MGKAVRMVELKGVTCHPDDIWSCMAKELYETVEEVRVVGAQPIVIRGIQWKQPVEKDVEAYQWNPLVTTDSRKRVPRMRRLMQHLLLRAPRLRIENLCGLY